MPMLVWDMKGLARGWSRRLTVLVLVVMAETAAGTCECPKPLGLAQEVSNAGIVFVGQITAGREEVLGEYKYFRAPGKRSWTAESDTPVNVQRVSEVRISRDAVIRARFRILRPIKGQPHESTEIVMGDMNCVMPVEIGSVYLVVSRSGQSTSHCEGSRKLKGVADPEIDKLVEAFGAGP